LKIEILGSGGASITPKPLCNCDLCKIAKLKGIPETRLGPSVFIHDAGILFDTPEEISYMLNRSNITNLKACFYSHHHLDHTMGMRLFECNFDYRNSFVKPTPYDRNIDIYVPDFVRKEMESHFSIWDNLSRWANWGLINLHTVTENEKVQLNDYIVSSIQLAQTFVSGYIVENSNIRVLVLMDELLGWNPEKLGHFNCVILPIGLFTVNPLNNERRWDEKHPLCRTEADFIEIKNIISKLDADKVVFIHIEEVDGLDHETLTQYVKCYANGRDWQVGFDTMIIEI